MIELEIRGTEAAAALFGQLARRTSDTEPAMRQIAGVMKDSVEENFAQEGRPKWESLSRYTIRARVRKGTWPGKILTEFGQLAASINDRHTHDTAIVGTNVKYGATQQFGDESRNIPARPYLALQPEDMAEIELRLLRHLLR